MLRPESPQHAVYRGFTEATWPRAFSRGIIDFDMHMQFCFPTIPVFDVTLHKQVERAKKAGRPQITVVDLGAGFGNFTRQFLDDQTAGRRTRALLDGRTTNTQVQFISVTDAESAEEHLQVREFPEAQTPENAQINAKEVRYSITSSQTVGKLFENLNIPSVDLVVASNFMTYLKPDVFKGVVEDVIEALEPNGQFQIFGYASIVRSSLSKDTDDENPQEDEPVIFMNKSNPEYPGVSPREIRDRGMDLLTDHNATRRDMREEIRRIFEIYLATGVYSPDQEADIRECLMDIIEPRELLTGAIMVGLPEVEGLVRIQKIREEKDAILEELKKQYGKRVTINYTKEGILIKKCKTTQHR